MSRKRSITHHERLHLFSMPTVLRQDGFAVMIYVHDHAPMHVHVHESGQEVVINLPDVTVRKDRGMNTKDIHKAQEIVASHHDFLVNAWKRIKPRP